MNYSKPSQDPVDNKTIHYFQLASVQNRVTKDDATFNDRLANDPTNVAFVMERQLSFDNGSVREDTQISLLFEEILNKFFEIKESTKGQGISLEMDDTFVFNTNFITEIVHNAFDHAKSDVYTRFEFLIKEDGLLVKFIIADKGPGIKKHLFSLLSKKKFTKQLKQYESNNEELLELLSAGNKQQIYQNQLTGKSFSTRVESPTGYFLRDMVREGIDDGGVDLILRDRKYEHTFSNIGGYISHNDIKKLPYNLVYYGAKLFPNKKTS